MNKHEKDYCINRINKVLTEKKYAIKEKHTIKGIELSDELKLELIFSNGNKNSFPVPFLERKELNKKFKDRYNMYFCDCFDLSGYEKKTVVNEEKIEEEENILNEGAIRLKDEIMLGDSKEALAMIREWIDKVQEK